MNTLFKIIIFILGIILILFSLPGLLFSFFPILFCDHGPFYGCLLVALSIGGPMAVSNMLILFSLQNLNSNRIKALVLMIVALIILVVYLVFLDLLGFNLLDGILQLTPTRIFAILNA
jgi:hypothetical protein